MATRRGRVSMNTTASATSSEEIPRPSASIEATSWSGSATSPVSSWKPQSSLSTMPGAIAPRRTPVPTSWRRTPWVNAWMACLDAE
jgi:hypothetical protein